MHSQKRDEFEPNDQDKGTHNGEKTAVSVLQRRQKSASSLLIVIAICIPVLILGGSQRTGKRNGNDIVVERVGGERVENLQVICIIIAGYQLPDGITAAGVSGPEIITSPNFAVGICGQSDNGPDMLIYQKEFRFT